jgi:DNA-binding NtrC family response regulator
MSPADQYSDQPRNPKKTVVMVVDDEPIIRETIIEILQDEGFDALGMSNAAHALLWIERIQPDIVLSDIVMPGMNGIDMAVQLITILPTCRIILFTGHPSAPDLLQKASTQGYTFEVFSKPIDPNRLIPRLREKMELSPRHGAPQRS